MAGKHFPTCQPLGKPDSGRQKACVPVSKPAAHTYYLLNVFTLVKLCSPHLLLSLATLIYFYLFFPHSSEHDYST